MPRHRRRPIRRRRPQPPRRCFAVPRPRPPRHRIRPLRRRRR